MVRCFFVLFSAALLHPEYVSGKADKGDDCHGENDVPIVPNVGMFASFDPVALDMACADAVNRQPVIAGSVLSELPQIRNDRFTDSHPETNWMSSVNHAEKIGVGTKEYELIEI